MNEQLKKKRGRPFKPKAEHAKIKTVTLTKVETERLVLIKKLKKFNLSKAVRKIIMEEPI